MISPTSMVSSTALTDTRARVAEIRNRVAALSPSSVPPAGPTPSLASDSAVDAVSLTAAAGPGPVDRGRPAPAPSSPARGAAGWAGQLPPAGQPWADELTAAANQHGIDPRLLASVVWTESGFDPAAVSDAGARGLGQLMPDTAAALGVDPDDPIQNLDGGARYLREQLDRFGRVDLALAAYNAGPGRVAEAGGVPRIVETQHYVRRVQSRLEHLT